MKNNMWITAIILLCILMLGACSNDEDVATDVDNNEEESNDLEGNEPDESENESDNETDDEEKPEVEDQLDLVLGDTGTFDTTLGTYEMTVGHAELSKEVEEEKSTRDGFILLDITIKNTSDHPLDAEDLIYSMEVTNNLDHSGSTDHAEGFDTVEEFNGELEPGDEQSAQFLTIVDDSDEYFFRKTVGNIGGGSSNQVVWKIQADEAK